MLEIRSKRRIENMKALILYLEPDRTMNDTGINQTHLSAAVSFNNL